MLSRLVLVVGLVFSFGCAGNAPPSLSPAGVRLWQADQMVVAIGEVQHVAIGLNGVQVCDPAPCHPLLSDANTAIVVDAVTDGINIIHVAPAGWKATGLAALNRIDARLDAAGKSHLKFYVDAARQLLTGE